VFQAYASRGYIAISVDSRYHGERAKDAATYRDVCVCFALFMLFYEAVTWTLCDIGCTIHPTLAIQTALHPIT
jgi:hypothetical protein